MCANIFLKYLLDICVFLIIVGMGRTCVYVHHVDKEAFLILLVLIILLFKTFILVVWSRAQCWPIFLRELRFTHLILVHGGSHRRRPKHSRRYSGGITRHHCSRILVSRMKPLWMVANAHYCKCGYLVGQPISNELGRELSELLVHKLAIRILVPAHVSW